MNTSSLGQTPTQITLVGCIITHIQCCIITTNLQCCISVTTLSVLSTLVHTHSNKTVLSIFSNQYEENYKNITVFSKMIMVCNFTYTQVKPTYFLLSASDSICFLCLTEK